MALPTYARSPWHLLKRLRISPPAAIAPDRRGLLPCCAEFSTSSRAQNADVLDLADTTRSRFAASNVPPQPIPAPSTFYEQHNLRVPRNIQAIYLRPLRRPPTHGVPVCNLQLRSYSARNLDAMADFCLRAAYYLHLPARGPVPLPRITQRWTVPRSNFVHKKSQENFERVTLRRLVQIQDGDPEVVRTWLRFVEKYAYYGVGMKANVWEWEGLNGGFREVVERESRIGETDGKGMVLPGRDSEIVERLERIVRMRDKMIRMVGYWLWTLGMETSIAEGYRRRWEVRQESEIVEKLERVVRMRDQTIEMVGYWLWTLGVETGVQTSVAEGYKRTWESEVVERLERVVIMRDEVIRTVGYWLWTLGMETSVAERYTRRWESKVMQKLERVVKMRAKLIRTVEWQLRTMGMETGVAEDEERGDKGIVERTADVVSR